MKCKKHGDIRNNYVTFTTAYQPVIVNVKPEIKLPIRHKATNICIECLAELLEKKTGKCEKDV